MSIFQHCRQISIVICYDFFSSFKSTFTYLSKFLFTFFLYSFFKGTLIFYVIGSALAGNLCFVLKPVFQFLEPGESQQIFGRITQLLQETHFNWICCCCGELHSRSFDLYFLKILIGITESTFTSSPVHPRPHSTTLCSRLCRGHSPCGKQAPKDPAPDSKSGHILIPCIHGTGLYPYSYPPPLQSSLPPLPHNTKFTVFLPWVGDFDTLHTHILLQYLASHSGDP